MKVNGQLQASVAFYVGVEPLVAAECVAGGHEKEINILPLPGIELLFLDHPARTPIIASNTLLKLLTKASESEMLYW